VYPDNVYQSYNRLECFPTNWRLMTRELSKGRSLMREPLYPRTLFELDMAGSRLYLPTTVYQVLFCSLMMMFHVSPVISVLQICQTLQRPFRYVGVAIQKRPLLVDRFRSIYPQNPPTTTTKTMQGSPVP
jgi:hypothetical protein